ncbi:hypothetical protein MANES_01G030000v8 [Manihot esculenta]|uniref:Uncharacterized protein n=1 Tax=Manihot esculenta TaxID=3983 RepID=A0A2C9WHB9_MANES|nr:hypothetical protein MANES_01G030000v8 [Manihot esculenta]
MDSSPASHGNNSTNHHRPSSSELISNAKMVADAAKSSLRHERHKVDKGRVAGAAANLVGAASRKFEGRRLGRYLGKAENFLRHYHSSHSTTTTAGSSHSATATSQSSS